MYILQHIYKYIWIYIKEKINKLRSKDSGLTWKWKWKYLAFVAGKFLIRVVVVVVISSPLQPTQSTCSAATSDQAKLPTNVLLSSRSPIALPYLPASITYLFLLFVILCNDCLFANTLHTHCCSLSFLPFTLLHTPLSRTYYHFADINTHFLCLNFFYSKFPAFFFYLRL